MRGATVLLTGVTGFVGKVVLERIASQAEILGVDEVIVVVRPRKGTSAKARVKKVLRSPAFDALPTGWSAMVDVVEGDLSETRWGLSEEAFDAVAQRVTHILHCAASVSFDLPVGEAAAANIDGALNVLELAKRSRRLVCMVAVSTAYVRPHPRQGVPTCEETLVPMPMSAEDLLAQIRRQPDCGDRLMAMTRHPNTYTLTKCIHEHLLVQRRGDVPLVIARPSVVSAALHHPVPGWIDSAAAIGGVVLYAGIGAMPAFVAHPDCRLDIVPVDHVAERIIALGLRSPPPRSGRVPIENIVAGYERSCRFDLILRTAQDTFRDRPHERAPSVRFMGPPEHGLRLADLVHRQIPTALARVALTLQGDAQTLRRLDRASDTVSYMNSCFEYFTNHTFDFRSSAPFTDPDFRPDRYLRTLCEGLYRHVLSQDDEQVPVLGRRTPLIDTGRSEVKPAAAVIGRLLEAGMNRTVDSITFDLRALERALAKVPEGDLIVLAPNHRSYLDFLLLGWLCHVRPGLGLDMPCFAAAEEFKKIPLLGEMFRRSGAFFIKRGSGRTSDALNQELARVASGTAPLVVFLEGKRSRDRSFLPPRRGVLRGLAATGRSCSVLPVGLSFDRVPEEGDLATELRIGRKPPMSLGRLAGWVSRAAREGVDLGRIHIAFGTPLSLKADTPIEALADAVMEQQRGLVWPSTWHLRRFLARLPRRAVAAGLDERWLVDELVRRGGRVLDSDLDPGVRLPRGIDDTLVNHWRHWVPEQHTPPGASPQHVALIEALHGDVSAMRMVAK